MLVLGGGWGVWIGDWHWVWDSKTVWGSLKSDTVMLLGLFRHSRAGAFGLCSYGLKVEKKVRVHGSVWMLSVL